MVLTNSEREIVLVTAVVTMLGYTALFTPYPGGLTNYEVGYGRYVYNGSGGVEGAWNCVYV